MKILVPVKRVIDYNVHIRVREDGSGVETQDVRMSMNPFDEIAMEAAIRLRESGSAAEVIGVSIGGAKVHDVLRVSLAMGADRVLHIEMPEAPEPLVVARVLKQVVRQESVQLVILGKQAIDGDSNQVGQMLAGLLDWPQATFASSIEIQGREIRVTREIDGGLQTVAADLPAVVTADLRLNEPRFVRLPAMMRAKKQPIFTLRVEDLCVDTCARAEVLHVSRPPARAPGIRVADVKELVEKLRSEAEVI
jgi:electron transfer flavoprotein beta subunit